MSDHTPGPWRAGYVNESDRKERMLVRAECGDGQPYVAICPAPNQEGNARLIAAAPDLLAAVEEYLAQQDRIEALRKEEILDESERDENLQQRLSVMMRQATAVIHMRSAVDKIHGK